MQCNTIIFDCDGTLLNTYDLIAHTVVKTFEECFPNIKLSDEEVDAFFGPLLEDSFAKYTSDEELFNKAIDTYHKYNLQLHSEYVYAYPNVKEVLKTLKEKNYNLVIVSNKLTATIKYGLEIAGINQFIDKIIGSDIMKAPKPDPDGIKQALNGIENPQALMVGDTAFDILAAKNAGIQSVGVTWCQTKRADFEKIGADHIIDDMMELLNILE